MPMSFYIKKAVAKAILLCTALYVIVATGMDVPESDPVVRPHAIGAPVELMDRYDCWSGDAPKDMANKVPGHVIIRPENKGTVVYGGPKMVHLAFEQLFKNAPTEHEIFGFCR